MISSDKKIYDIYITDEFTHYGRGNDGHHYGKWLLFSPFIDIEDTVELLRNAIEKKEINITHFKYNHKVLAIFTNKGDDEKDIMEVAEQIRTLIHYPANMYYKPNELTKNFIYSGSTLKAHKYVSKYKKYNPYENYLFVD
jgi:hypothetical protein